MRFRFEGRPLDCYYNPLLFRRDVRVVEGARLESVYTLTAYRGFEPLSLRQIRHFTPVAIATGVRLEQVCPVNGDSYRFPRDGEL